MKSETEMPAACSRRTASAVATLWVTTSRPPSVVISSRFSGTSVTWLGFTRQAISIIAGAIAASRLSFTWTVCRSTSRSRS